MPLATTGKQLYELIAAGGPLTIILTNRAGAATVQGGVYAVDVARGDAASTDEATAAGNAVVTAAGNLQPLLCVAEGVYADDTPGTYTIIGATQALVDGTTDVGAGDRLIPQAASPNLIKQGAGSLVANAGFAREAQTTNAGTLTNVYFDGRTFNGGKTPAS